MFANIFFANIFAIKFALCLKLNKLADNFAMKFASIIAKNLASLHDIQNDIVI